MPIRTRSQKGHSPINSPTVNKSELIHDENVLCPISKDNCTEDVKGKNRLTELRERRRKLKECKPAFQRLKYRTNNNVEMKSQIEELISEKKKELEQQSEVVNREEEELLINRCRFKEKLLALPLPFSYQELYNKFLCCDTSICWRYNRKQLNIFEKVKEAVESTLRKSFSKDDLGRMMSVSIRFYDLKYIEQNDLEMKLLECERFLLNILPIGLKNSSCASTDDLNKRKRDFRILLTNIVLNAQKLFLKNEFNIEVHLSAKSVNRWHPNFDLESKVPEIPIHPFPNYPIDDNEHTIKSILTDSVGTFVTKKHLLTEKSIKHDNSSSKPFFSRNELLEKLKERKNNRTQLNNLLHNETTQRKIELENLLTMLPALQSFFKRNNSKVAPIKMLNDNLGINSNVLKLIETLFPDLVLIFEKYKIDYCRFKVNAMDMNISSYIYEINQRIQSIAIDT
ncbi:hypothetical protein SNEBB_005766 [Seison nebaliae]|nr:hypothetical protein SNEBB_005766 [Seison nebaliae]